MSPYGRMTSPTATKGLAIRIDNPQETYQPGDVLRGRVFRQVPVLVGAEDVNVTVQLVGFTHVVITEWSDHTGESRTCYTSGFEHLGQDDASVVTLHKGPLHIPRQIEGLAKDTVKPSELDEGIGVSWPFEILIPEEAASHLFMVREPHQAQANLAGTEVDLPPATSDFGHGELTYSRIPPTHYTRQKECGPGQFLDIRVKYFIEAKLESAHANNQPVAIEQVTIGAAEPPNSLTDSASDSTLVDKQLKFSDRVVSVDGDDDAPMLFRIGTPTTLYTKRPSPLILYINAQWSDVEATGQKDKEVSDGSIPHICVSRVDVKLISTTTGWSPNVGRNVPGLVRAPATASYSKVIPFHSEPSTAETTSLAQIQIPFGKNADAVDIGSMLNIRAAGTASLGAGQSTGDASRLLPPSLVGNNAMRTYQLEWELNLDIDGKAEKITGNEDIWVV